MSEKDLKQLKADIEKLESKKALIHADISQYGKDLEALQNNIVAAEALQVNLDSLKSQIKELQGVTKELSIAKEELAKIQTKKESALKEVEKHNKTLSEGAEAVTLIDKKKAELASLESKVGDVTSKLASFEEKVRTLQAVITSNEKRIQEQDTTFNLRSESLTKDHENKVSQLTTILDGINADIASATAKKNQTDTDLKILTEEYSVKTSELAGIKNDCTDLETIYVNKKAQKELELDALSKVLTEKELDLNTREGAISLKDSVLDQKRRALEVVKARLEKEKGSSINIEL